jgi:hypothetical protein
MIDVKIIMNVLEEVEKKVWLQTQFLDEKKNKYFTLAMDE